MPKSERLITVLCARRDSHYHKMANLDVWDINRDAFRYTGKNPVVTHPPCRLFGKLSPLATQENWLTDLALALFCLRAVKQNGGVLEHPARSKLWKLANLPRPGFATSDGFTIAVPQYWFGHRADKMTWLYVSKIPAGNVPEIPFALAGRGWTHPVEKMGRAERERTPLNFARWLVELASRVENNLSAREIVAERQSHTLSGAAIISLGL